MNASGRSTAAHDACETAVEPATNERSSSPTSSRRKWAVLAVLAAVAFTAQLDLYIANVAIPSLARSFHGSSLGSLSWILNGYAVMFAALLVPAGRLADHYGRRRFLIGGMALFTIGSALCAAAPSLTALITGRFVQGVGAAMVIPPSLGLIYAVFPSAEHKRAVGVWAGVAAVAGAAGPSIGGLLVAVDWRWIFLLNVPIGIAVICGALAIVPEVRGQHAQRPPALNAIIALFVAVCGLILITVQGSAWGWASPKTLALLAVSLVAVAVTVRQSLSNPRALIEAGLMRSREFAAAAVVLVFFFAAFGAWLLGTTVFLQDAWHYSPLRTGLAIAPAPFVSAVLAANAGPIAARLGRRTPALVGSLCFAGTGLYWLLTASQQPSYLRFLPGLLLCGIGAGMTQAPMFAAAGTLPAHRATTGSAVLNMARQIGSAFGVAILTALLGPGTHSFAGYRRGWVFLAVASVIAAFIVTIGLPRSQREAPGGGSRSS